MADALEIEATDVIKVIMQFCKEANLHRSFEALQTECNVSLNTVDNIDSFLADINHGRWDLVLPQVTHMRLPTVKLFDLYEQVVLEMIELRETETARVMLRTMSLFGRMKQDDPERFLRLDKLCQQCAPISWRPARVMFCRALRNASLPRQLTIRALRHPPIYHCTLEQQQVLRRLYMDVKELYGDTAKDKRRAALAHTLAQEVQTVPPSRLMNIINDALRWRKHLGTLPQRGAAFDLVQGAEARQRDETELYPTQLATSIPFGKKSHPECAAFTLDGQSLVTGSVDGFLEVWDAATGTLRKDLEYQANEEFMVHESPVLCIAASRDGIALVSGDQSGGIKVWKAATGRCLQRFDRAHAEGVTSMSFSRDGGHVLSSSFDGAVRVHGLRSGKMLKEFRGHKSCVNCAIYSVDGAQVFSASSDGSVRVWDTKTCECVANFNPAPAAPSGEVIVNSVLLHPAKVDELIVCTRSNAVYSMTTGGTITKTFTSGRSEEAAHFVAVTASPRGAFLYALGGDGNVCCFNVAQGRLEHLLKAHEAGTPIGLAHHPHRNVLATFADEEELKCWKAA